MDGVVRPSVSSSFTRWIDNPDWNALTSRYSLEGVGAVRSFAAPLQHVRVSTVFLRLWATSSSHKLASGAYLCIIVRGCKYPLSRALQLWRSAVCRSMPIRRDGAGWGNHSTLLSKDASGWASLD
jgi:hypothetical protein